MKKIQFNEQFQGDSLDYQDGEYSRRFDRKEQPFEVSPEEEARLLRTPYFTPVVETATTPEQQGQPGPEETQQGNGVKGRQRKPAQDNQ
jgi:hypothetical protein